MAQSFARHRSRSLSSNFGDESYDDERLNSPSIGDELSPLSDPEIGLSIYIFPHPPSIGVSSAPSSPYACSSVLSIPTDVSFPSSSSVNLENYQENDQERVLFRSSGRFRRERSASRSTGAFSWTAMSRRRSASVDTQSFIHDDISWEGARATIDEPEYHILGPPTARFNQSIPHRQEYPIGRQPWSNPFTYTDGRFQRRKRLGRGQPALAEEEEGSSSDINSRGTPVPLRLPLVDLFSRILSLDPSTLKLISHPSAEESLLFPGVMLKIDLADEKDITRDRKHVLRMAISETHSVKDGMDIACDRSISPNVFSYFSFIDVIAGICSSSRFWWTNATKSSRTGRK